MKGNNSHRQAALATLAVSASVLAIGTSHVAAAQAVCGEGSNAAICQINNSEAIGGIAGTYPVTIITNSGTITGTPAISQGTSIQLYIDNEATGSIESNIEGNSLFYFGVRNAGEIDGFVFVNDTGGPNLFTGSTIYYIADGGTVGSVQLGTTGYSAANFIQRGADPGTDTITAGNGLDAYTKSYNATQSVALRQYDLPDTFELEGYEILGADKTLTLTGAGETIMLMGDGRIRNEAVIGLIDTSGVYPITVVPTAISSYQTQLAAFRREQIPPGQPGSYYTIPYGEALASFTNSGIVNGDIRISTASFANHGEINLSSDGMGTIIRGAANQNFQFINESSIILSDNGSRPSSSDIEAEFEDGTEHAVRITTAIEATQADNVLIQNGEDAEISGGLSFNGIASEFVFNNDGVISIGDNPFEIDRAVDIEMVEFPLALDLLLRQDVVANSVTITNGGTLDGGIEGTFTTRTLSFTNTRHINADVTDPYAAAVNLGTNDWPDTPTGEDVNDTETLSFLNTVDGTIVGSIEMVVDASLVTITNNGSITQALRPGHGETVGAIANSYPSETLYAEQETALGAELVFNNTGTVSNADYAGGAVFIDLEAGDMETGLPGAATANATVTVTNSGSIVASGGSYLSFPPTLGLTTGQLGLDFNTALAVVAEAEGISSVSITNQANGLIDARGMAHMWTGSVQVVPDQPVDAGGIAISVADANTVTIVNQGTIRGGPGGNLTVDGNTFVPINAGDADFEGVWGGAIDTFSGSTDSITNSVTGIIEGGIALRAGNDIFRNYGTLKGNLWLGAGDDTFLQGGNATFIGIADGGAGNDTFILDLTGGGTNNVSMSQLINFEQFTTIGSGAVDVDGSDGDDNLGNEGTLDGDVALGAGNDTYQQNGTVNGNVSLGTGNDSLIQTGTINGDIDLGEGNNSLQNAGTINGTVNLGTGNNEFANAEGGSIVGNVVSGNGNDNVQNGGAIQGTVDLGAGDNQFANGATGTITGNVVSGNGDDSVQNEGTINGAIDLGAGNNQFTNGAGGTINGNVASGTGSDNLGNDGNIVGDIHLDGEGADSAPAALAAFSLMAVQAEPAIEPTGGDDVLANGGTVDGNVFAGGGDDQLANTGTITGLIDLGDGDDTLLLTGDWAIGGDVNGGAGTDKVQATFADVLSGEEPAVLDLSGFTALEQFTVSGGTGTIGGEAAFDEIDIQSGSLGIAADAVISGNVNVADGSTFGNAGALTGDVTFGSASNSFTQTGTITGDVLTGAGNDQLANQGTITGLIDLGEGDDTLLLTGDWAIGGDVNGGAGTDKVQAKFADASSEQDLPVLDLSGFAQIEQFQVNGGLGKVGGEATFDQIDILSGRLIGASGSVITANVDVASGATFGSAGTVVGDIAVASGGTLSPGASPAIMTVVGDVSLASGSITTFEFVPAPGQSDQLIIDGNLTIAGDAVLNMTGNRPLTPGIVHDMIIADSITGEFAIGTWDQSAIQGFLRYFDGATDNRLQLMGTFLAAEGTTPQARAAIDYVNGLLISGDAGTALLEAVPSLLASNGYASAPAFALVTPEPYAAASQLGVENGLSLAKTFRSGIAAPSLAEPQLFTFAGALGNWRPVRGNSAAGTSRAKNDGYGMVGGIGYGSESGSIAAFIGYLDSEQRIKGLGSKTDADGLTAGVTGKIAAGGFNLSALLAYDWSKAKTRRVVPGDEDVASTKYDLHSLVLDATAGYEVALSDGWAIEPQVGITHVSTRRGSTIETGSDAFALEVDKKRLNATFVDGAVTLRGRQGSDTIFQPWLQLGVRHQLEGDLPQATAALAGMDTSFTVLGAARKETVLTAGAGFSAQLSPNFRLMAAYQGEFGGGTGTQLNVGINLAF